MKQIYILIAMFGFVFYIFGEDQIKITSDTKITITRQGDFDNTGDVLENWLCEYLTQRLKPSQQAALGEKELDIILFAKNKSWREMKFDSVEGMSDIDAFTIDVSRNEGKARIEIKGTTAMAVGFGIVKFLEDYLGIAWVFPGNLGKIIPQEEPIILSMGNNSFKPHFTGRSLSGMVSRRKSFKRDYFGTLYKDRSFFWSNDYVRSLMLNSRDRYSHNMINIFPLEETKQLYPEIFPITKGNRFTPVSRKCPLGNKYQPWHPCYSNPKTVEIVVRKAKEAFSSELFPMFSIGINDGHKIRCECGECKKIGWPESYYCFVKKVAEKLKAYYPKYMVGVLCYSDVVVPPKERLPENVMLVLTRLPQRNYKHWLDKAKHFAIYQYVYGFGYSVPNLPWNALNYNVSIMCESKFDSYYAEVYPIWAFDAPKMYVMSRLLWNPRQNVDKLLLNYCNKAFGIAGTAMTQFYRQWQFFGKKMDKNGFARTWDIRAWRDSTAQFSKIPPETVLICDKALEKAKSVLSNKGDIARLDMVNIFYQYTKTLWKTYRLRDEIFSLQLSKNHLANLKELLDLRQNEINCLAEMKKHPEWFTGSSVTLKNMLTKQIASGKWSLDTEWNNAVLTCLWRLKGKNGDIELPKEIRNIFGQTQLESSPIKVLVRNYHPMNTKRLPLIAMNCEENENSLKFQSKQNDSKTTPTTWQYASGIVKNIPLGEGVFLYHNVELNGKNGEALIDIILCANNRKRKIISLVSHFNGAGAIQTREFIVEPTWMDRDTRLTSLTFPKEAKCQFQLFVTWKPFASDSSISGNWCVERMTAQDKVME